MPSARVCRRTWYRCHRDNMHRARRQLAMIHYTLRTDLPAFFAKQMTADIYAPDILFEESVSSIGLSCHGHASYRYIIICQ